jgi:thiamine biosynthesis lipoprotein
MIPVPPDKETHRFEHRAMNTLFEIIIANHEPEYARQASAAAFAEIDRLENMLSRFREGSDVSRINRLAGGEWERVGLDTFTCLQLAAKVWAETNGAFDVTIAPLQVCWRNPDGTPRVPSPEELSGAQKRIGMDLLWLDETAHAVGVAAAGVQVDLGGIGKGYAIDNAAELLREWSITRALIHGGGSSVLALGSLMGKEGWPVTLRDLGEQATCVLLANQSMSGSGLPDDIAHIYYPGTGQPANDKRATWSVAPTAGLADALSTAFMVMSLDEVRQYCETHSGVGAAILDHDGNLTTMGIVPGRNTMRH